MSERLPVVITVPVASGSVIVRSAVGSVTETIVSKESAVTPSKVMLEPKAGLIVELISAK
jgi:hypothetical protein